MKEKERDVLVDHQRADDDLLTLDLASVYQCVLLVKERDERRAIMSTIRLRREYESITGVTSAYATSKRQPGIVALTLCMGG